MNTRSVEAADDRSVNAVRLLNERMDERLVRTRRVFLKSGILIGGAALAGVRGMRAAEKEEEEVSPSEDLMREHGVLKRVLLIYEEAIRRMMANEEFPVETVVDSAKG